MKKAGIMVVLFWMILSISACHMESKTEDSKEQTTHISENTTEEEKVEIVIPAGSTLMTRFLTPEGYSRSSEEEGSLAEFLRAYPLKNAGSSVLLYNGEEKGNQNAHVAVMGLPIENEDLQQCADSVMRVYAEYFWETKQYDKIKFHLSDGFEASYVKWREGYRISFENDVPYWYKKTGYDDSYETFVKYLRIIFAYAGTASMETYESEKIGVQELEIGDVFLRGGSPGHVVMVVDVCEDVSGQKAFLLAQGYMPAQEFHVLKNPLHEENPWYYEEEIHDSIKTPEHTFHEGSLRKLNYIP